MTQAEMKTLLNRQIGDAQEALFEAQRIVTENKDSDASILRQVSIQIGIALGVLTLQCDPNL